jgi:hypothetical protein
MAFFLTLSVQAQDKFFTKTGNIYFNCTGGIEKIEATNNSVTCVIDSKSGEMQFAVQMKGFEFEKALMQEHFNENYAESEKFPRAVFAGSISNNKEVNYKKDGTYSAKVKGKLTIHGETKDVTATGNVVIKKGAVSMHSAFSIQLSDYKIAIPSVVKDKISNDTKITVDCSLDALK